MNVRPLKGKDATFDRIVLCAGVGSRKLAALTGDRVNVYPVKGSRSRSILTMKSVSKPLHISSLLDDAAKIVTSQLKYDRFRWPYTQNSVATTRYSSGSN